MSKYGDADVILGDIDDVEEPDVWSFRSNMHQLIIMHQGDDDDNEQSASSDEEPEADFPDDELGAASADRVSECSPWENDSSYAGH